MSTLILVKMLLGKMYPFDYLSHLAQIACQILKNSNKHLSKSTDTLAFSNSKFSLNTKLGSMTEIECTFPNFLSTLFKRNFIATGVVERKCQSLKSWS